VSDTIRAFFALVLLFRKEDSVKCVILGKAGSTRVKLKNYRPFYREQSLMDILLAKLTAVIRREDVYLSCEREEYRKVSEEWGVGFIHRDERYTAFTTSNVDVVRNVCKDVPGNEDILWVSSVEPFFDEFPQVLECWDKVDKRTYDSLNVVYPKKMFLLDQNHNPIGWGFGHWHKYSQELPPVYQMSWAVAILSRQCISEVSYIIGARPYWYESTAEAVDIDIEHDWELAQEMYRQKQAKVKVND
jgi:N-acylneuraminate cytidylyltransferase